MPCANPIRAYRPATGGPLIFTAPDPNRSATRYEALDVPCGTCILCRQEHARQWAVRITHEAMQWDDSSFITLTYDNTHLPPHNSLNYPDLRRFLDRLRKRLGTIRYYAVGEYGDETLRPHYHACIFGASFYDNRVITRHKPTLLWTSAYLEECWGLGQVTVGALNFQTARYCASYVTKKLRSGQTYMRIDEDTGELIPVAQPRAIMSRNIGRTWWDKYGKHTVAHDMVVIDGSRQKPPKAYDKWLAAQDPERAAEIKRQRKEQATQLTPDQNRARARNAHARVKRKSKSA